MVIIKYMVGRSYASLIVKDNVMLTDTIIDQLISETIQTSQLNPPPEAYGPCESWEEADGYLSEIADQSVIKHAESIGEYEIWGSRGLDSGSNYNVLEAPDSWILFPQSVLDEAAGEVFDPQFGVDQLDGHTISGVVRGESPIKWTAKPTEVRVQDGLYLIKFEFNSSY